MFKTRLTTAIQARAIRGNTTDEHNPTPPLLLHALDAALDEQEARAQVHVERVVEFLDGDVPDVDDALAVAGVGDEDVDGGAGVGCCDGGVEIGDLGRGGDVDLVGGDLD